MFYFFIRYFLVLEACEVELRTDFMVENKEERKNLQ